MEKMPPKEKIYEAYSAIADGRVTLLASEALVQSSDFQKTYTVRFLDDTYSSNDNATFWQGYPGYPVISVLLLQGRLPFDNTIIPRFSNINWHALNEKYKRNYQKAVDEVLAKLAPTADIESIRRNVVLVWESLRDLPISIKRLRVN